MLSFCKINKIPLDFIEIRVGKKQHLTEEFKKISPARIVPVIIEKNTQTGEEFRLFESHAILRYLTLSRNLPDHWFPKDPILRAKVDQYLDWHHSFLRQ